MNTDKVTTWIGAAEAVGIAGVTYMHTGVDFSNPVWWVGMVIAILSGLKGYFSNKPSS